MTVQSVLIPKKNFTFQKAKKYIRDNNYIFKKVDIAPNYYRFRQVEPELFNDKTYFTKTLNDGVLLVIGDLKK